MAVSLLAFPAEGERSEGESGRVGAEVVDSRIVDSTTYINANLILMFVSNTGLFGRDFDHLFDVENTDAGTFYPYISTDLIENGTLDRTVLYQAGPWIAGKVNDSIRVAAMRFSSEYVPWSNVRRDVHAGRSFLPRLQAVSRFS